ncbi:uncharacterized protein KY384_008591 [Bacidia gigantensis]|uniref:uncharacterized protein n=1 Tax=Bacidia gigantensis TaxID=2732470 RepID=UPI001D04AFE4|nr:uncharacterized protein KY384_008591 [Bacidia gigantensis]KAG8527161.1 hypothetical protein KY384_008591 [Bacidia gigantensis]
MKSMAQILFLTAGFHAFAIPAKSFLPSFLSRSPELRQQQQQPIMNIPIPIPGGSDSNDKDLFSGPGDLIISDVIGKESSINIFAGFTRDVNSISKRFDDSDKTTTVLAPLNSELKKLPRKPWEDPEDYNSLGAEAYKGSEGEDRATRNLRRFVEAHIIPASPWEEGKKVESLRGETVWWEKKDGKKLLYSDYFVIKRFNYIPYRKPDGQQYVTATSSRLLTMNSHNPNAWPPGGPGPPPPNTEQHSIQQRPPGSFGPAPPLQRPPQHQMNGPSMPQQPTSFFTNQPNGHHALPNPQNLPPQASPLQSAQSIRSAPPPSLQQHSPTSLPPPPSQQHYPLPALGPSMSQQSPRPTLQADRDMMEREQQERLRQQEMAQARYDQQEAELISQQHERQIREMQAREQQQREYQQRDQLHSPRENHAGTIPLQQPVASRVPATLHGPNGILNEQHITSPHAQPSQPLGAPSGPGNVFSGSAQSVENGARHFAPQVPPNMAPQQQLIHLTQAAAPQQTNGVLPMGQQQQQQPILNDALTYLDQVKVRFQEQPDVYNHFLDIMKDFKSQVIDTPGVIDRVSGLFNGNPELISGFNTFLPPGYKIECGLDNDPNVIRVTTPMGGMSVSQMPGPPNGIMVNRVNAGDGRAADYSDGPQRSEWGPIQQQELEQSENALFAATQQPGANLFPGQPQTLEDAGEGYDDAVQADVRGLSNGLGANQHLLGGDKRGPVEFNHAIGYVNKIKNRFASQPDIYKNFLEILQTYQRESKPIGDVYAQVTQLFSSAQDLLEDFKQFLPESAAQAKAQAQAATKHAEDSVPTSNMRGGNEYSAGAPRAQVSTPRPAGDYKFPPMGTFAPPSVGKDNKKRRGGAGSQMTGSVAAPDVSAVSNSRNQRNVNGNKRSKAEQAKPPVADVVPVSPTLVPSLPTPLKPSEDESNMQEGISFFERVKKFLGNRQTFNEFLKLCNLFNQEIIDKDTLVHKTYNFIGSNIDLMSWFKRWLNYEGRDHVVLNTQRIPSGKVVLSNCRGLGPSYRLLPRRERLRSCSGRDEMCNSVLNDEWVSHPTWASEESGFIAHRKNLYEEALHKIEEERHDYDINIEACLRTIQLLEPIAQQLKLMTDDERYKYELPPGIGSQSETIYRRVIKKIYDRERGGKVIEDMFKRPNAVIPILLGRLKQKVEEWKASQREWEKVWREQTNRIFWKSLDHQGITVKSSDKRQFQPKTLHNEIHAKYEEQRRQRLIPWTQVPRYQFKYGFNDFEVLYDACHLLLTCLHVSYPANEADKLRLDSFIKTFIPTFFDVDREAFEERMNDIEDATPPNEEMDDDEANTDGESNGVRGRRGPNGKKQDLRRGVLERKSGRGEAADRSGVTTPDVQSNDEDTPASAGTPTDQPRPDPSEHRWMSHPVSGSEADLNVPFRRDDFHLYATSNIYCFFRMFQGLYERLQHIKALEHKVHTDVRNAMMQKPAHKLGLFDKIPTDYFADVSSTANYYKQTVQICEEVIKSEVDSNQLEDMLRRYYMHDGWQLFTFDKMCASILRFALLILVSDNKDKSLDIINLFYKDRKEDETTHQNELTYRKQVEKFGRDGDIFRIRYNRPTQTAYVQIFKKDDKTYEADELAASARWSYYVSTYSMLDHTESVPLKKMSFPYLRRNRPFAAGAKKGNAGEDGGEVKAFPLPMSSYDGLVIRISPNNYHLLYDPYTYDWWLQSPQSRKRGSSAYEEAHQKRKEGLSDLFENKERNKWMSELKDEDIQKTKDDFQRWLHGEHSSSETVRGDQGEAAGRRQNSSEDTLMGGTA